MAGTHAATVFISHSHSDRQVARCLVRRLSAHGIKAWIDERELKIGAALSTSIRDHIEASDLVLVVASTASAESQWVRREMDFAREHGKPIVPLFIESVAAHERFRDCVGIEAMSPQEFADSVHRLMRDLYSSLDLELPAPDLAALEAGLRELAREEPDLAPLIIGCLDGEGLHQETMDTAFTAPFHPLDDALNALCDLLPAKGADHAAYGFGLAGAGARGLFSWISASGDGDLKLVTALGRPLAAELIPTAIKMLGACNPPNNHALYQFIHRNVDKLDEKQRRAVLRLVTWPVRNDTSRLADVLAWVAIKHFPGAVSVQQIWSRWVRAGAFDGATTDLAKYMADAHKERIPGWEEVHEALRSHVRGYLRSGDERKVELAIRHIRSAADQQSPALGALAREAEGVAGTAEWKGWRKRDPVTAERMEWNVFSFTQEAMGDRNWLRAAESAERMLEFEKERRRLLTEDS